jgi:hypothetical protein
MQQNSSDEILISMLWAITTSPTTTADATVQTAPHDDTPTTAADTIMQTA